MQHEVRLRAQTIDRNVLHIRQLCGWTILLLEGLSFPQKALSVHSTYQTTHRFPKCTREHVAHSELHTTDLFFSTDRKGLKIQIFTQSQTEKSVADRIRREGGRGGGRRRVGGGRRKSPSKYLLSEGTRHCVRHFPLYAVSFLLWVVPCPPHPFR